MFKFKNSERGSLFLVMSLSIAVCVGLSACQQQSPEETLQEHVITGPIMGTDYRITVRFNESDQLNASKLNASKLNSVEQAALNAMQAVNQSMSTYIRDSELSQLNRARANQSFALSDDLATVLSQAETVSVLSNGAFDITIAQAVNAWGFGVDGRVSEQPTEAQLNGLLASVGYQKLSIIKSEVGVSALKKTEGLQIDLSAIAKGYAIDKVAQAFAKLGIQHYLINIGGELRAKGHNSEGLAWRVGIEKPHVLGGIQQVISLHDQAIATSGDYRNTIEIDGQLFSHTLNPVTLKPVLHRLALVSVLNASASMADALATAMMVMGEQGALDFAKDNQLAAYFVIRQAGLSKNAEDLYKIEMTEQFKQYLL